MDGNRRNKIFFFFFLPLLLSFYSFYLTTQISWRRRRQSNIEIIAEKNKKIIKDNQFVIAGNVAMSAIAIGAMTKKKRFRVYSYPPNPFINKTPTHSNTLQHPILHLSNLVHSQPLVLHLSNLVHPQLLSVRTMDGNKENKIFFLFLSPSPFVFLFILFNDADLVAAAAAEEADLDAMSKELKRPKISNEKEKGNIKIVAEKNKKIIKDNQFVMAGNIEMSAIAIVAMAKKKGFRLYSHPPNPLINNTPTPSNTQSFTSAT